MQPKQVGIIGLGNMGCGMAQTFLREGFEVWGVDLDVSQKTAARNLGVQIAENVEALCQATNVIVLSLPTAKHVQSVIQGSNGIMEYAQPKTLILDTSTSEPEVTRFLARELKAQGHQLLDCPVSGGPAGASSGTMVILVGGDQQALEQAHDYLEALSSKVVYLGESGNGHVAKLINNLLCAAHLATTAEAVVLGKQAGLDPTLLIEGLNAGSGRSAISEVNFPRWVLNNGFDSGFTMQLMRKDVGLAKQLIEDSGLELSLSKQAASIWAASKDKLADQDDFNSIVKMYGLGD